MEVEEIVDSLKAEIKSQLGFPAFLVPQKAGNNTAHIDLLFLDMTECGEGNLKLVFGATYRTAGTHAKWLTKTVKLSRTVTLMNKSEKPYMPLTVAGVKLRAYWIRTENPRWLYPSEEESSMPAEYVIPWTVEIDIPERFLED
ncbi:MAG: hypothetical protein J5930_04380 [Treponema sp.]|nr:hypothetical protein [Treponema sp.]